MRPSLPRLFAALPDAITATIFITAWVAPSVPGPEAVKNLMLTMLIEFIVVHSSAFYAGIAASSDVARAKRMLLMLGLAAFYMMFVFAFALAFDSTWPIYAFAWLLLSRFWHLWMHPSQASRETERMMMLWAASCGTYVFGALITAVLPLPALGVKPEFVASMHLSGSGVWIERPQTVLAFGLLYFAIQAWVKYALTDADAAVPHPAPIRQTSAGKP
jgi:hypothetical protein